MKLPIVRTLALCSLLILSLSMTPPPTYTLTVKVNNADSNEGYVLVMLFKGSEGFPSSPDKAVAYDGKEVSNYSATLVFEGLEEGEYAIAVLHDENSNGKMDTNMLGIPKEAYGASNDAKATFGPPKFEDAKFEVSDNREMNIKLRRVFQ